MNALAQLVRGRGLLLVLIGLGAATAGPVTPLLWRAVESGRFHPHAPDWALFASQTAAIQLHVVSALVALVIGIAVLALPKGCGPHKALGWSWIAAMATTALSSFFITGLNGDFYSFIHLLSGWVLVALPMGVYAIRRRDIRSHRRAMVSLFVGGLIVAGAFTFIPGRFMFNFIFG
ncbi:MAG: DUF2306 domain-containing protein [Hyphomonadaceae bacterium]